MQYNIAFYVHHHGSGHIMRCIAIAEKLRNCNVSFLGSNLDPYHRLIPADIHLIHLPMDTASSSDTDVQDREVTGLHYAPLGIQGQISRIRMITAFFQEQPKTLFVVDVSVEMVMLATLAGIPAIVVRQHGKRGDLPHQIAYTNALGLLAPYSAEMHPDEEPWLIKKTFFTGGFSRYQYHPPTIGENKQTVAVLIGKGGSSIDEIFLNHLAALCPAWRFEVIGTIKDPSGLINTGNLSYLGQQDDPVLHLQNAAIVIGNAGHNTVMEVASLGKRFVVIPEERPFDEQVVKANTLANLGLARIVFPETVFETNWSAVFEELLERPANWGKTIDPRALDRTAEYLKMKYREVFGNL